MALNPVVDALRRNGHIEFVHVRHEEYGVFAAVADAYLTGKPVVVAVRAGARRDTPVQRADGCQEGRCAHYCNCGGCGDKTHGHSSDRRVEPVQILRDSMPLPRTRCESRTQARAVINTAILTAVVDHGPPVNLHAGAMWPVPKLIFAFKN